MTVLRYEIDADDPQAPPMGLIVLQADETIEPEFRRRFANSPSPIYVSRIPSSAELTHESLVEMQAAVTRAASLFPSGLHLPVVGYACTSASAVIGSARVEELVQLGCNAGSVTNPLRAAVACSAQHGISKLALISPYVQSVNEPLIEAFAQEGIDMPVFGTFEEGTERNVARISAQSMIDAAVELGSDPSVEGVFLSCTNLRTQRVIEVVEARLGKPVLSSNQSLAWHMTALTVQ